jgi:hypothetical protein
VPVDGQPHRIHAPWVVRFPAMNVAHNTLRARRNRSHAVKAVPKFSFGDIRRRRAMAIGAS